MVLQRRSAGLQGTTQFPTNGDLIPGGPLRAMKLSTAGGSFSVGLWLWADRRLQRTSWNQPETGTACNMNKSELNTRRDYVHMWRWRVVRKYIDSCPKGEALAKEGVCENFLQKLRCLPSVFGGLVSHQPPATSHRCGLRPVSRLTGGQQPERQRVALAATPARRPAGTSYMASGEPRQVYPQALQRREDALRNARACQRRREGVVQCLYPRNGRGDAW